MSSLLEPFATKNGGLRKPEGLELSYLQGDSRLCIVAGSDTTAATLAHLFYHLALEPSVAQKLRKELKPYMNGDAVTNTDVQNNDYLNGVIYETLRLHPPVPTALNRNTPPEGIEIAGTHIPGNADVWCPQYVLGRSDAAYKDPESFVPERWYSKTDMVTNKTAWSPFSQGIRAVTLRFVSKANEDRCLRLHRPPASYARTSYRGGQTAIQLRR